MNIPRHNPASLLWRSLSAFPLLIPGCLLLTLLGGLFEGASIAAFLPVLQILFSDQSLPDSPLARVVHWLFATFGLSLRLNMALGVVFGLYLLQALALTLGQVGSFYISAEQVRRLQARLYDATLDARYRFLIERDSAHLINILRFEAQRAGGGITVALTVFGELIAIGVYLCCSMLIDWRLTVGAMLLAGLILVLTRSIILQGRRLGERGRDERNAIQSHLSQSLASLGTIKGMAREATFRTRFRTLLGALHQTSLRNNRNGAILRHITELTVVCLICLLIFVGAPSFSRTQGAGFILMLAVLHRTFKRLSGIPVILHGMEHLAPSIEIVDHWLAEALDNRETSEATETIPRFERLVLRDLSFAYRDEAVLRGIDLEISRGEMVALVGRSGAGKTTIVGLALGLLRQYEGQIEVNGAHELREVDPQNWRGRVGYVSQEVELFGASVADNISFFEPLPESEILEAARQAHCIEFIDRLPEGLQTRIGERGVRLSGGQRQRLALARALAASPELLILDEATSEMDLLSEERIRQAIDGLRGELTILAIAHRLSTIRNADRIFVLAGGRIVQAGTYDELISTPGEFRTLYPPTV